jgi:hypothetical protein
MNHLLSNDRVHSNSRPTDSDHFYPFRALHRFRRHQTTSVISETLLISNIVH